LSFCGGLKKWNIAGVGERDDGDGEELGDEHSDGGGEQGSAPSQLALSIALHSLSQARRN